MPTLRPLIRRSVGGGIASLPGPPGTSADRMPLHPAPNPGGGLQERRHAPAALPRATPGPPSAGGSGACFSMLPMRTLPALRGAALNALKTIVSAVDLAMPPVPGRVIIHSVPDIDDNVVALLRKRPSDVDLILLADDPSAARRRLRRLRVDADDLKILPKKSLRAAFAFTRSAVSIGTHGLYRSRRRGRGKASIGVWHGDPMKLVGIPIGDSPMPFDISLVGSELARSVRALEFGVPRGSVVALGTPRLELINHVRVNDTWKAPGDKWIVWLPTYRQSVRGEIRRDGTPPEGPLPFPGLSMEEMERVLTEAGATLWLRAHPLAADFGTFNPPYRSASDAALEKDGKTLYELLARADLLVTDYSSVWIDFLHTGMPMVGACYDLDEYRRARPLAWEPYEDWFPGPICGSPDVLLAAIKEGLENPSVYGERRAHLKRVLASSAIKGISEQVWNLAAQAAEYGRRRPTGD